MICPLLLVALAAPPVAAQEVPFPPAAVMVGTVRVIDGDGLAFGQVQVRLRGIAAPEDSRRETHPDGPAASAALRELAQGQEAICVLDGSTANRRAVGVCFVDGLDVGAAMVGGGWALDCPAYSGGMYAAAEAAARSAGRDLARTYVRPGYC